MELEAQVASLTAEIRRSKVFLYMVIHDLKHPTESLRSQLTGLK
jgi:hypothetical protein